MATITRKGQRTTTQEQPASVGDRPHPGATRTARLGLLLMAGAPVFAALGDPSVLVYAAPMIIVPAVVRFLVGRHGRWAHLLAAVTGLLGLAIALPGTWVIVEAPDSLFDVVPTVTFLLGGGTAIVAGVAGTVERWSDADLGWLRWIAPGLIASVAMGSIGIAVTRSGDLDPAALVGAIEVRVDDRGFDPEQLSLPPGQTVTLALHNDGRIVHTFTSTELDVDVVLSPGEAALAEVTVPDDLAGLQFWCVPHSQVGDDGRREWMVGELAARG